MDEIFAKAETDFGNDKTLLTLGAQILGAKLQSDRILAAVSLYEQQFVDTVAALFDPLHSSAQESFAPKKNSL